MFIVIGIILLSAVSFFLYATVSDKSKNQPKTSWFYIKLILWILAIALIFHFPLFFAWMFFESLLVWIRLLFVK
jgi:hypothetical protein